MSPNGQYSITVTDEGIVLSGPDGEIVVDRDGARINENPYDDR